MWNNFVHESYSFRLSGVYSLDSEYGFFDLYSEDSGSCRRLIMRVHSFSRNIDNSFFRLYLQRILN